MAFLRSTIAAEPPPELRGRGIVLRMPEARDFAVWSELRALSREHLTPWEPQWATDELTRASFRRRLRRYQWEMQEDLGYAFFIFRREDRALVGGVTLSNVRRGVSQAASIGYWMGAPFAGQGYMSDAVLTTTAYAFDVLGGREVTDVYSIDASMFDAQDWRNMGASAVDAVDARTRVEKALETVKRVFEQRQPKKPI